MSTKDVLAFCRKNLCRAVIVDWKDDDSDWHYFRVERVFKKRIAFTGMTDDIGSHHIGDFFWADASEIRRIKLR